MTLPLSQSIQNNNKCPHGFPQGACPICSGMGSRISSDRNKPRRKGEMSYNECLAEWNRMKAQKQAKLDASKKFHASFLSKSKFNSFANKVAKYIPKFIKTPIRNIFNFSKTVLKPVVNIIKNVFKPIINVSNNIFNFISSTSEKLSSHLGEIKNFIQEKILNNIKTTLNKSLKTVLFLFTQGKKHDRNKNKQKVNLRKLKKVIRKIFKKHKKENKECA